MAFHRAAGVRRVAIGVVTAVVLVGAATVPALAATGFDETKLTATDGGASDLYGFSVAVAGDRVVVGAPSDDDKGSNAGAVYVYEPDGTGGWAQTKLTATDGQEGDVYGSSVAVAGDRVVVGAYGDDDKGTNAGAVYVYEPDGAGWWAQTKLTATDGQEGDVYGSSVAVAGDRVVVGAPSDDDKGPAAGAVYVYEPDGAGGWAQTKLTATDGDAGDEYGSSVAVAVAVAGDRVLVGAPRDDDKGTEAGAVYVYEPDGAGGWAQTKLTATDGDAGDEYGDSVAAAGDRVLVGAPRDDDKGFNAGAVYVYEPDGAGGWAQTKLTATDGEALAVHGSSVAVAGDRVVVGAYGDDDKGTNAGAVYVYEIVADAVPPVITVPDGVSVSATELAGAVVSYEASAVDAVDGEVAVGCMPASGTVFPLGTTTVTCTAVDQAGNLAEETFDVTVTVPAGAAGFTLLIDGIRALGLPKTPTTSLEAPLKQAAKLLTDSKPGNDGAACDKLVSFQGHVDARLADGTLSPENADLLRTYATALADTIGCAP